MSHLREVIADHLLHTAAILVADRDPCIRFHAQVPADRRTAYRATPDDLKAAWCKTPVVMAIILCPGSDTTAVARFVKAHRIDPDRVHFYHTQDVDVVAALYAWRKAGFSVHSILEVKDGGAINKHFAAHWNHAIHDAICKRPGCVLHVVI